MSDFRDDQITGEEYAAEGGSGPRRWSIDPIDGTGNLVHGLPLWAISIGLIDRGEPVLGVIAIPPLLEMYWAVKGQGAWRDGQRLLARDAAIIHDQDNICMGTNVLRFVDSRSVPGRLRDLGTACCEQVFVAAGRLQACTFLGEAPHDIAAGVVISSEAGCAFGTLAGERLSPAEMLRRTPISTPTFVAPPLRLEATHASCPSPAFPGRAPTMNRVVARLPETVTELCLVRIGIQVRRASAWLFARRLRSQIAHGAQSAMAGGAGSLARTHSRLRSATSASSNTGGASMTWKPGRVIILTRTGGDWPSIACGRGTTSASITRRSWFELAIWSRSTWTAGRLGLAKFGVLTEPVGPLTTSRGRLGRFKS